MPPFRNCCFLSVIPWVKGLMSKIGVLSKASRPRTVNVLPFTLNNSTKVNLIGFKSRFTKSFAKHIIGSLRNTVVCCVLAIEALKHMHLKIR